MSLKTEAIVLQERPLREADRLYYLLTPREGLIKVLVKSAGRSSSKLAGHMQPFSRVSVMIGRGKKDHLAGVTILDSHQALRADLKLLSLAGALSELVMRVHVAGQSAQAEYQLVRQTLALLADAEFDSQDKAAILRIFLWKLLSIAGWQPDFYRCHISGIVEEGGEAYYLPTRGFVSAQYADQAITIPEELVFYLQHAIASEGFDSFQNLYEVSQYSESWSKLSQNYYQDILERPLNSLELFKYLS